MGQWSRLTFINSVQATALPLLLAITVTSQGADALPLARKRALDHLEGDDFTLSKRALDLMEGDGFGFEKRALDTLEGDDFNGLKRRRRALDILEGDGFSGFQRKRALDMLEGDSWSGMDKRSGARIVGFVSPAGELVPVGAAPAGSNQRHTPYGQRLVRTYKRALDALEGNSFGF